jgi:hypothetical protein
MDQRMRLRAGGRRHRLGKGTCQIHLSKCRAKADAMMDGLRSNPNYQRAWQLVVWELSTSRSDHDCTEEGLG